MPKRTDIHTILIIGSGPIVIGEAAELGSSSLTRLMTRLTRADPAWAVWKSVERAGYHVAEFVLEPLAASLAGIPDGTALGGQVIGRIDTVKPVAQIIDDVRARAARDRPRGRGSCAR